MLARVRIAEQASGRWWGLQLILDPLGLLRNIVVQSLRLRLVLMNPVSTLDQTLNRIAAAEADIRALGVERLALFGSVLRGSATPDSDIDFVVKFRDGAKSYDRFNALCDLLEEMLGRRVELVTTEALSPYLGPRILAEARDVLRAA